MRLGKEWLSPWKQKWWTAWAPGEQNGVGQYKWPNPQSLPKSACLVSKGEFPLWDVLARNHGSFIYHLGLDTCFDEYNYHDSLRAGLIEKIKLTWPLLLFGASLQNVRLGVGAGSNLKTLYLSVTLSKTGSAKALWLIQVWSLYRGLCSGCDKAVAESRSMNPNVFIFLNSSTVAYPWEEKLCFSQKGSQWQMRLLIIFCFKIEFYPNNIKLHVNYILLSCRICGTVCGTIVQCLYICEASRI